MKVVIVGSKDRVGESDRALTHELMTLAAKTYPGCIFVTMLTQEGVGQYVKEKCLQQDERGNWWGQFVECNVRLYAKTLSKTDTSAIYLARNATVAELCDVLVFLASPGRKGMVEELADRIKALGRPYVVLMPGDPARLPSV